MRFYDGVVAVVIGVVATSLAGCGGGDTATTTTTGAATPTPTPPPTPPTVPIPTVTTPTWTGDVGDLPTPPNVSCNDTSLKQTLANNLSCTEDMSNASDTCCAAVVGWGGNIDVLVSCQGENAAADADKTQIYNARCMCAGGGQWQTQLQELNSANMTACEHPWHPLPTAPAIPVVNRTCACDVLESAKTTLTASAGDNCETYVNGAIDTFGWGALRTACEAIGSSDLSVESDLSSQEGEASLRVDVDAKFPWVLVAAAGVAGLTVMVVFRMTSRPTVQSDVTELGASC